MQYNSTLFDVLEGSAQDVPTGESNNWLGGTVFILDDNAPKDVKEDFIQIQKKLSAFCKPLTPEVATYLMQVEPQATCMRVAMTRRLAYMLRVRLSEIAVLQQQMAEKDAKIKLLSGTLGETAETAVEGQESEKKEKKKS